MSKSQVSVDLAPMPNSENCYKLDVCIYRIEDAIVPDTESKVLTVSESDRLNWMWVIRKEPEPLTNPRRHLGRQRLKFAFSSPADDDLKGHNR